MMNESEPGREIQSLFHGPAPYRPETAWGVVSASLMSVVICGASFVGVFLAVLLAVSTGATEADVGRATEEMLSLATPTGLATAIAAQIASLTFCVLAAGRGAMRRVTLQLANGFPSFRLTATAVLVVLAVTTVVDLLLYFTSDFDLFKDSKWLVEGLRSPLWWGTVIAGIILAPLWEEFTFRGFLLSALAKSPLGIVGAGLISNLAWTLLHWGYSWQALTSVFIAGCVLTWLIWRTGNIWVPVIAHGVINTAALAFAYTFAPL